MSARTTTHRHRWTRVATLLAALPLAATPLLATSPAHAAGGAVGVTADVPPANSLGWYKDSPTVTLEVTADDGVEAGSAWKVVNGGATIASGPLDAGTTTVPVTAEGTNVVSWKVVGPTGRQATGSREIKLDQTAPTIAVDAPTDGAVYTQGQAAKVMFGCDDQLSLITTCVFADGHGHPGDPLDTSTPGLHRLDFTVYDKADNLTTRTVTYRVLANDTTAPTVGGSVLSGTRGSNGWFTSPSVTFRSTAVDPEVDGAVTSGLHHIDTNLDGDQRPQSTTSPVDVTVSGEGEHVLKWAAADDAGNASGVQAVDLDIDSVLPTATISYPADGAVLSADSAATARFGCDDATSGVDECRPTVDGDTVGATLDLTRGVHHFQVLVKDNAGNGRSETVRYTVPGAEAPSRTKIKDLRLRHGRAGSVTVVVKAEGYPEGTVRILDGQKVIGTAPVVYVPDSDGTARAVLDLRSVSRGVHRIRAVYTGSQLTQPSRSKVVKVRVR